MNRQRIIRLFSATAMILKRRKEFLHFLIVKIFTKSKNMSELRRKEETYRIILYEFRKDRLLNPLFFRLCDFFLKVTFLSLPRL